MGKLLYTGSLLFLLVITQGLYAQNYEVTIVGPGNVKINGSSNINHFSLVYKKPVAGKRTITFSAVENNRIPLKGDTRIALEVYSFSSSQNMITRDFKKMLKSDIYPFINIELSRIIQNRDNPSRANVMAILTIANTKRLEVLPVRITMVNSNTYTLVSSHKISLKNYNLEPPKKVMGMVSVNDVVSIDLSLTVQYKKV